MEIFQYMNLEQSFWVWWVWGALKISYELFGLVKLSWKGEFLLSRVQKSFMICAVLWVVVAGVFSFSPKSAFLMSMMMMVFQKHWRWRQWAFMPITFDVVDVVLWGGWGLQCGMDIEGFYLLGAALCSLCALFSLRIYALFFYMTLCQSFLMILVGGALDLSLICLCLMMSFVVDVILKQAPQPMILRDLLLSEWRHMSMFFWPLWLGGHVSLMWLSLHWLAETVTFANVFYCVMFLLLELRVVFRCPWLQKNQTYTPSIPLQEEV